MNTRIKSQSLDISAEEFEIIKSDLEKLLKVEPDRRIIKYAEKLKWSIDQKDIIIGKNNQRFYRIEFFHNEKDGDRNKRYVGSINYNSPVIPNK